MVMAAVDTLLGQRMREPSTERGKKATQKINSFDGKAEILLLHILKGTSMKNATRM